MRKLSARLKQWVMGLVALEDLGVVEEEEEEEEEEERSQTLKRQMVVRSVQYKIVVSFSSLCDVVALTIRRVVRL